MGTIFCLRDMFKTGATSLLFLCLVLVTIYAEVESTKIAYTKPINGKTQIIKTKTLKYLKTVEDESTTLKTTTESRSVQDSLEFAESTQALHKVKNTDEENVTPIDVEENVDIESSNSTADVITNQSKEIDQIIIEPVIEVPENHIADDKSSDNFDELIASTSNIEHSPVEHLQEIIEDIPSSDETTNTTESSFVPTTNKGPTPCTCGIFMTSQIKRSKNPYDSPTGPPVISNELDRFFPCNAVGQKQCQTKCLEVIVQHLPNSANILCATIDRDIRKERAYLYIKNCRNQWYNTNLAAGREYCCKNGQPYQCPLV